MLVSLVLLVVVQSDQYLGELRVGFNYDLSLDIRFLSNLAAECANSVETKAKRGTYVKERGLLLAHGLRLFAAGASNQKCSQINDDLANRIFSLIAAIKENVAD